MVTSNNIEQMADSAGLGARGVGENGVDRAGSRHGVQSPLARGARRAPGRVPPSLSPAPGSPAPSRNAPSSALQRPNVRPRRGSSRAGVCRQRGPPDGDDAPSRGLPLQCDLHDCRCVSAPGWHRRRCAADAAVPRHACPARRADGRACCACCAGSGRHRDGSGGRRGRRRRWARGGEFGRRRGRSVQRVSARARGFHPARAPCRRVARSTSRMAKFPRGGRQCRATTARSSRWIVRRPGGVGSHFAERLRTLT